jgi:hypothetical protein
MSNLAIFKNPGAVAASALPPSKLGQQIAENSIGGYNRIATNTNGTFKRIINGEQVGKAIRGEFNAIIVDMLEKPSREFYANAYDPDAKGTMPDCYSLLGDKPDAKAGSRQAANCASCPKNIDGSGQNGKGKACRFKRKIALLLEGDTSGEVYQFNVPAKSLFGKGNGSTHPFESYCRFLVNNGAAPDRVVTTIAYNLDAESMELNFTPDRFITEDELELVERAQANPLTRKLIQISAGEAEKPKALPKAEEEEEEKAPAIKPATVAKKANKWEDDEDEDEAPKTEPAKRASKKEEPVKLASDIGALVSSWADDEDEE